jgi:hypothetical protein
MVTVLGWAGVVVGAEGLIITEREHSLEADSWVNQY